MSDPKLLDFDAMWREVEPEKAPPRVARVFGEEIALPSSMPAKIILRSMRLQAEGEDADAPLTQQDMLDIAGAIYGRGNIERWLDEGLTLAQLGDLVNKGIGFYIERDEGDADDEDAAEGNATGPKKGRRQSSKSGA